MLNHRLTRRQCGCSQAHSPHRCPRSAEAVGPTRDPLVTACPSSPLGKLPSILPAVKACVGVYKVMRLRGRRVPRRVCDLGQVSRAPLPRRRPLRPVAVDMSDRGGSLWRLSRRPPAMRCWVLIGERVAPVTAVLETVVYGTTVTAVGPSCALLQGAVFPLCKRGPACRERRMAVRTGNLGAHGPCMGSPGLSEKRGQAAWNYNATERARPNPPVYLGFPPHASNKGAHKRHENQARRFGPHRFLSLRRVVGSRGSSTPFKRMPSHPSIGA